MKNVWITGANGQLGKALSAKAADYPSFTFFYTDIDSLDITDREAVRDFVKSHQIDILINTAAYTAVDQAEKDTQTALLVNAEAVKNLAEAVAEHHGRMIHISTDYVFDGMNHRPYQENDGTRPLSAYGRSKLAGEILLQEHLPEAVIVRTSWLYAEEGNNFLRTMLRLGQEKQEVNVVFDQIGTPTYAGDLADCLLRVMVRVSEGEYTPGVYHYSNEGVCSWYDFAVRIMSIAGLPCRVNPIETKDYPTPAARPFFSVLNKTKIKEAFALTIPHWEESLRRVIRTIQL